MNSYTKGVETVTLNSNTLVTYECDAQKLYSVSQLHTKWLLLMKVKVFSRLA